MKNNNAIKNLVKEDIKKAARELDSKYGLNNLHGFALGTDDDVRTLYHVVCTHQWVDEQTIEQDYKGIAYIFVEWTQVGDDHLFLSVAKLLNQEADKESLDWAGDRDKRFAAIGDALAEIRDENIFALDTFLYAGSTDPSDHMEELSLVLAKSINTQHHLDGYFNAMGYIDE